MLSYIVLELRILKNHGIRLPDVFCFFYKTFQDSWVGLDLVTECILPLRRTWFFSAGRDRCLNPLIPATVISLFWSSGLFRCAVFWKSNFFFQVNMSSIILCCWLDLKFSFVELIVLKETIFICWRCINVGKCEIFFFLSKWFFPSVVSSRRLPSCENWRSVQWEISCDPKVGLGTLFNCVAIMGYSVSFSTRGLGGS